ncbi:TetR/AcrR family transcriptional regulator [Bradyrhizobium prioriisuperbiae]|uniref:TetR/AcrR family transcriptional regulator n=1 Tax=Bradyrhizobium prioriisuperbiae TaxID=2854389 RepID=UPI0028EBDFDE|nr:TetR/AcrR family transcriptional regulator [Bradyrhizobium prioritasuperba]
MKKPATKIAGKSKTAGKTKPPARSRNAVATRAAILDSARQAFARSGYDGAGVREIAAGAGVTAMLVNRYFGSKEELFAEVITTSMATPTILTPQTLQALASADIGKTFASALVGITTSGTTPLEGFLIMMHSAASKRAAEIGREQIEKHYQKTLSSALSGELAPQRAALLFSLVAGVQVMRQMIGLSALAKAEPAALIKLLAPLFQQLIAGNDKT